MSERWQGPGFFPTSGELAQIQANDSRAAEKKLQERVESLERRVKYMEDFLVMYTKELAGEEAS